MGWDRIDGDFTTFSVILSRQVVYKRLNTVGGWLVVLGLTAL